MNPFKVNMCMSAYMSLNFGLMEADGKEIEKKTIARKMIVQGLLATLLFHRSHQEQGSLRRDKGHKSPLLTWSDLWGMFYGFIRTLAQTGPWEPHKGFVKKSETESAHLTEEHVKARKAYVVGISQQPRSG